MWSLFSNASGFYLPPFYKLVPIIFCGSTNYYLGKVKFHVVCFQIDINMCVHEQV